VHGATTTELWIQSERPLERLSFEISSLGVANDIHLRLGDAEQRLSFAKTDDGSAPAQIVQLAPSSPSQVRSHDGATIYVYHLEVEAARGTVRTWERRFPPQDCFEFAYNESSQESFLVGAQIAYLGDAERLERDLYSVDWLPSANTAPTSVAAGETFFLDTSVGNTSQGAWPADLPTRVALSYRWKKPDGTVVVENGLRTHPQQDIHPGQIFHAQQEVLAPTTPGSYVLELDLVYELVSWFSWKNGDDVLRLPVEVTAALPPAVDGTDS
jgi:hypothetical protein